MRFLLILWILGLSALTAIAQDVADELPVANTPREKIIDDMSTAPTPAVDAGVIARLRGSAETEPAPEQELAIEEDESVKEPEMPLALAPFYTSAPEYLTLRAAEKHDQLALDYLVETSTLDEGDEIRSEQVRLLIGPDYASLSSPNSQKIYDFKMNRLLEIKPVKALDNPEETALFLDNVSIFAKAYRNINTVRQATDNGQKRRITIGKDLEVDSFWLESSMSWSAAKLDGPLKIKSTDSSLLAIWDGLSVVSASFDGPKYENSRIKNAFFAYIHHAWPIHPEILVDFYAFNSPPKTLEMVSFGPNQPKGQKQKWTLTSAKLIDADFPLPLEAMSPVERKPMTPLVFVISEAVKNQAVGGIQSAADIEADFEKAQKAEDKIAQWIAGQKYIAYTGKCEDAGESWLCAALKDLSEDSKFAGIGALDPKSKSLSDFINATEMAKSKQNRAAALLALQPYLDDAQTPAFILRTAAMARASMKSAIAKKAGVGAIQAEALLKQALAKDPYDPHTYIGLAQIYAANGAYEQSWDIYDVLRAAIPTVGAVQLKIDHAESKLLAVGPGYFLPK
ncbi:MAG: tetratricopeptide repeat protein [Acidimicrobiales bacterium]|nr:tetratricopeptide repeat protein [Hyphomonadaceae bacterium]RZV44321.1 MAG: tetratricopeptide repeat protein [Acidimicrobiales bacterium]